MNYYIIKFISFFNPYCQHKELEDGADIIIVGGGPAGSFFAIEVLKKAKKSGKKINVTILEKKVKKLERETVAFRDSCNYCAGGISPKMFDLLKELRLSLPKQVIQSQINSITLQSHWKNIVLKAWRVHSQKPRRMFTVYRGARPKGRTDEYFNFDSFLLHEAVKMGAQVISTKVEGVSRSNFLTFFSRIVTFIFLPDFFAFFNTSIAKKDPAGPP
ncbi:MAG: hypothetical protein M1308_03385, partial [Actinobacteria bacterium]|nr:hypothetical protein [Actinomycetota bacterium]